MSLRELAGAFQEALRLNERALERLEQGASLESLDELFAAKAEALARLEAFDLGSLKGSGGPVEALFEAQEAQSRCARSETRLAEALSQRRRLQKNVNQVTEAYGSKVVDKLGTKGLDLAS